MIIHVATTHRHTLNAAHGPWDSIRDTTMVFFAPEDGMKKSINLYAYAAGTGLSMDGSKVRANSNPVYE